MLRDKLEKVAIPKMEKRFQWIVQLIQIDREWQKVNDDYSLRKMIEVMRIGTEDRLIKKEAHPYERFILSLLM